MKKEGFNIYKSLQDLTPDILHKSSDMENSQKDSGGFTPNISYKNSNWEKYKKEKENIYKNWAERWIGKIIKSASLDSTYNPGAYTIKKADKDMGHSLEKKTIENKLSIATESIPQPIKERVENKNVLSAENLKMQKAFDKDVGYWKEKLTREYEDKDKNSINKANLAELQANPTKWLKRKFESRAKKLKIELNDPANADPKIQENLKFYLEKTKASLNNLKEIRQKNIPLKIGGQFTSSSIKLDRGGKFDITKNLDNLNKILGKETKNYSIEDVIQRANTKFLVLKTAEGETIEIEMKKIHEIQRNEKTDPETELKKIRKGDIFEVTENGKKTIYNILSRNADTITYRIGNSIPGTSSVLKLKEFLSKDGIIFKNLTLEKIQTVLNKKETQAPPVAPVEKKPKLEITRDQLKEFVNEIAIGDSIKIAVGSGIFNTLTIINIENDNITIKSDLHNKTIILKRVDFEKFVLKNERINSITKAEKVEEPKLEPIATTEQDEIIPELKSTEEGNKSKKNLEINSIKDQINKRAERSRQIEIRIAILKKQLEVEKSQGQQKDIEKK